MILYSSLNGSELLPNATLAQLRSVTPPTEARRVIWATWALFAALATILSSILVLAILSSRKARAASFNLYLVGLFVAEGTIACVFTLTCLLCIGNGSFLGVSTCGVQAFVTIWCGSSQFYMNMLMAVGVYHLVDATRRLKDFQNPPMRKVFLRCFGVYVWTGFLASWMFYDALPLQPFLMHGLACSTSIHSAESELFYWLVYCPLTAGVPLAVCLILGSVCCVRHRIMALHPRLKATTQMVVISHDTLHYTRRVRRARSLRQYFLRIFGSLLLLIPVVAACTTRFASAYFLAVGVALVFVQVIVSAMICMNKSDIGEAVQRLLRSWRCRLSLRVSPSLPVTCPPPHAPDASACTDPVEWLSHSSAECHDDEACPSTRAPATPGWVRRRT